MTAKKVRNETTPGQKILDGLRAAVDYAKGDESMGRVVYPKTTDPLAELSDLDRERQCYALLQRLVHCERVVRQAHTDLTGMGQKERKDWIARAYGRLHKYSDLALLFLNRHREELDDV